MMFDIIGSARNSIGAGRVRAVAVTSRERNASLPDVPSMRELGIADCEVGGWYGLYGPARLPADIVTRLNEATRKALAGDELKNKLIEQGYDLWSGSRIVGPLAAANKLADMPDFNDPSKLVTGKEMVERLNNLIATFENPALDFSRNRADSDDIPGDAYEYLMRHYATESGKSKGQFYTPAEVSRIMAKIIGIGGAHTTSATTVYDPTCGSGSLLLKVGDEAAAHVTLYGQEKGAATSGLARMNMILHDNPRRRNARHPATTSTVKAITCGASGVC